MITNWYISSEWFTLKIMIVFTYETSALFRTPKSVLNYLLNTVYNRLQY